MNLYIVAILGIVLHVKYPDFKGSYQVLVNDSYEVYTNYWI